MNKKEENRAHHFEFPGQTGSFAMELKNGCFLDVEDDELYTIGKTISSFLYGFLLENRDTRDSYINIFQSVLKDITIFIEDKNLNALLRFSQKAFHNGDYENSLFLSKLILARINQIIDEKIANNNKRVDKEIIHLQISTLNFIGYLFSKLKKNIDYGLKLTNIAKTLLNDFDQNDKETIALKSAIYDTLGGLYILKEDWDNAVNNLHSAHEYDKILMSRGQVDEIGFRLTYSNLGYAIVKKYSHIIDKEKKKINPHEITENLEKARKLFMMVKVDKSPAVPEKHLKDLELLAAVSRMKEGLSLLNEVKKKLRKRFI